MSEEVSVERFKPIQRGNDSSLLFSSCLLFYSVGFVTIFKRFKRKSGNLPLFLLLLFVNLLNFQTADQFFHAEHPMLLHVSFNPFEDFYHPVGIYKIVCSHLDG